MTMHDSQLSKDSPLPLYYQLKEIIKAQIAEGAWKPGDAVPSERELVERYRISRPTVRQAVHELVTEGLLTREQGRGTFVARPKIHQRFLESLTSFSEEMKEKGLSYSTKLLSIERIAPDSTLRSVFGDESSLFYRLERLRFVEGSPVLVVTTYLPAALFPELDREPLETESLYDIIESKYKRKLGRATRVLEAILVGEADAELLAVPPRSAVQLVRTTGFLEEGTPFEYSIARYRGDVSSFTVSLTFRR